MLEPISRDNRGACAFGLFHRSAGDTLPCHHIGAAAASRHTGLYATLAGESKEALESYPVVVFAVVNVQTRN